MAFITLRAEEKDAAMLYLVKERVQEGDQTIIFVATKHHVEYTYSLLQAAGKRNPPASVNGLTCRQFVTCGAC